MAGQNSYGDEAISTLLKRMEDDRDSKFGNGRWVRNLFEAAASRQAARVADLENPTKEQLMTLTLRDIGIKLKDPDVSAED